MFSTKLWNLLKHSLLVKTSLCELMLSASYFSAFLKFSLQCIKVGLVLDDLFLIWCLVFVIRFQFSVGLNLQKADKYLLLIQLNEYETVSYFLQLSDCLLTFLPVFAWCDHKIVLHIKTKWFYDHINHAKTSKTKVKSVCKWMSL